MVPSLYDQALFWPLICQHIVKNYLTWAEDIGAKWWCIFVEISLINAIILTVDLLFV